MAESLLMTSDTGLLLECAELKAALAPFPTLRALHASRAWPHVGPRLEALLSTVRRWSPPVPPSEIHPGRLRAVHWNIEKGNQYARIEGALTSHPHLRGADLVFLNEVDLGMARSGNRDVAFSLARALGLYAAWVPLFLETTAGRDDDARLAGGLANRESMLGIAVLSRWPLGDSRVVPLPSPDAFQFRVERMYGRHAGLCVEVLRPGATFVAVAVHLEVHRSRAHRAAQMRALLAALAQERRPVLLAGDFNTHTFERGRIHHPVAAARALVFSRRAALEKRLLHPDRGRAHEPLFEELHRGGFEWEKWNDRLPTLRLRMDRVGETRGLVRALGPLLGPALRGLEGRAALRLDWFAGRGFSEGRGHTVHGLDGADRASDHAPIVAEFG